MVQVALAVDSAQATLKADTTKIANTPHLATPAATPLAQVIMVGPILVDSELMTLLP